MISKRVTVKWYALRTHEEIISKVRLSVNQCDVHEKSTNAAQLLRVSEKHPYTHDSNCTVITSEHKQMCRATGSDSWSHVHVLTVSCVYLIHLIRCQRQFILIWEVKWQKLTAGLFRRQTRLSCKPRTLGDDKHFRRNIWMISG